MALTLLAAVQADALYAVMEEQPEWEVRHVLRWYSRTFCTPLHEVEELPPEDVFRAWFEVRYEKMDREELLDEARLVIETPEQRAQRLAAKDAKESDDDAFMAALEKKLVEDSKKEQQRVKAKGPKLVTTKVPQPKAPPKVATVDDDDLPPIKVEFKDEPIDDTRDGLEPL